MTTVQLEPWFTPVADRAVLVEFATEISDEATGAVFALDRALASTTVDGLTEVVPALVNVLVVFDPSVTDHPTVERAVRHLLPLDGAATTAFERHRVPVCYDDALGPDLPAVAAAADMTVEAVIGAHLAGDYQVLMYGFAPGYAYMAGVPEAIRVPRKPAAVRGIAAGSVIMAGPQCLVTTLEMPTGWSIIGRSPVEVLQDDPDQPFLFAVGDRVTFERVDLARFDTLTRGR